MGQTSVSASITISSVTKGVFQLEAVSKMMPALYSNLSGVLSSLLSFGNAKMTAAVHAIKVIT